MTLRQRKHVLWTLNAALAAALAVCVAALAFSPLDAGPADAGNRGRPTTGPKDEQHKTGPMSAYAGIYRRDLRKPLYDVKPAPVVKPAKPKPRMTVTLVGTALEPGFTYGMFRTKSGATKFVSVGETIEGVEVLEISEGSAKVRFAGEVLTLKTSKGGKR